MRCDEERIPSGPSHLQAGNGVARRGRLRRTSAGADAADPWGSRNRHSRFTRHARSRCRPQCTHRPRQAAARAGFRLFQRLFSGDLGEDVFNGRPVLGLVLGALELPSPSNPPGGCPFHKRCPSAQSKCAVEVPALAAGRQGAASPVTSRWRRPPSSSLRRLRGSRAEPLPDPVPTGFHNRHRRAG